MDNLFEGLKEGDLEDLVLPLVSIDEYESKLDDDSIVIAFFVKDKEPAQDLNRFIQKGAVDILDTDVSPAPTEEGNFMVFVELLRDDEFPAKCLDLVSSLDGLTSLKDWMAVIYDVEGDQPLTPEVLQTMVRLDSHEDHTGHDDDQDGEVDGEVDEELIEFFKHSDLEGLSEDGRKVTLEGLTSSFELEFVDLGPFEALQERNAVLTQGLRLDEAAQHNVSRLKALLGDLWLVEHLQNHVLFSSPLSEDVALFRL